MQVLSVKGLETGSSSGGLFDEFLVPMICKGFQPGLGERGGGDRRGNMLINHLHIGVARCPIRLLRQMIFFSPLSNIEAFVAHQHTPHPAPSIGLKVPNTQLLWANDN
ncbi:uncharacterized protein [Triticum aestivum]|uniref:uncharacterized protein isoform X1 n=1 Tax=Triticum aestivum TaxID=4565 RepID=UPI001D0180C5|nr:uncharacterized protein LOC123074054 isoform X1 [Triticum aestivum]